MSLSAALQLAEKGFHVFPLVSGEKTPAIQDFPNEATRDPEKIKRWWVDPLLGFEQPYNVGISTSKFNENETLIVIDVDNKDGKNGSDELKKLPPLPGTYVQHTPTGGQHFVFRARQAVKQGAHVLGRGLDIRSRGGYIVGASSRTERGAYTALGSHVSDAPDWLVKRLESRDSSPERRDAKPPQRPGLDEARSESRAIHFLTEEAPLAIEGEGGDETTFKVACRVKDFGCSEDLAYELMFERWNSRCEPPWSPEELKRKISNAYGYGENPVGCGDPASHFIPLEPTPSAPVAPGLHPFDVLNQNYAYVLNNGRGHILYETEDEEGGFKLDHLGLSDFHDYLAAEEIQVGGKNQSATKLWMKSKRRRTYRGICFKPNKKCAPHYYNVWRGFAVSPLDRAPTPEEKQSVDAWIGHARENICQGDEALFSWLMSYCAHIVQKPWERPLVALVLRGGKGVGKSGWIERLGFLLGKSFDSTSDQDVFLGQFNSVLENKILLVAEEAFWSGDKDAEGKIKDLITRQKHKIRRLYCEAYDVDNCLRLVIIGNEDWLVPASEDERRYAVFDVGDGRKQDRAFFREMREGMEAGGYRYLLRYLLDYKITDDVTLAPKTEALMRQKERSLKPFHQWWLDSLTQGRISGFSQFAGDWPESISKESFRQAFRTYWDTRRFSGRLPDDISLGKLFKECCPSFTTKQVRTSDQKIPHYFLPTLDVARKDWERFIGHPDGVQWETDIETTSEEEELFK